MGKEKLSTTSKKKKRSLRKRAWCQTESRALDKSTAARIVRKPSLGLLNPFEMDSEKTEFDLE